MANPRKPADRRQNRVTRDVVNLSLGGVETSPVGRVDTPKPPIPVGAKARRYWEAFWRSPVAQAVSPDADAFLLARWIVYVQEWEEATVTLRKEGMTVEGSTGQTTLHPLARHRQNVETAIFAIERELGLTPKARATLGIAVNEYKRGAAELMTDVGNLAPVALDD